MRLFKLVLATATLLSLAACGGGGYTVSGVTKSAPATAPIPGNWYLATTSSSGASNPIVTVYNGPLTVSGSTVSLTTTPSSCFDLSLPLVLSGPTSGSSVSFASPQSTTSGFVLTITGNVSNGTNIDGTYQLAGSTDTSGCHADVGTVYGTSVPLFNGSWTGTVTENQYPSGGLNGMAPVNYVPNAAGLTISTTQATNTQSFMRSGVGLINAFPLSGSVAWINATCYSAGTIDPTQSYIFGNTVNISVIQATGAYPTYALSVTLPQPGSPLAAFPVTLSPVGGPCDQFSISGSLPVITVTQ